MEWKWKSNKCSHTSELLSHQHEKKWYLNQVNRIYVLNSKYPTHYYDDGVGDGVYLSLGGNI